MGKGETPRLAMKNSFWAAKKRLSGELFTSNRINLLQSFISVCDDAIACARDIVSVIEL